MNEHKLLSILAVGFGLLVAGVITWACEATDAERHSPPVQSVLKPVPGSYPLMAPQRRTLPDHVRARALLRTGTVP